MKTKLLKQKVVKYSKVNYLLIGIDNINIV